MDTQTRIEAAKANLAANRAVLVKASAAGPSCYRCKYFRHDGRVCLHPAFANQSFDPVTRRVTEASSVGALQARAADGLCGQEAVLFERKAISWAGVWGGAKEFIQWAIFFFAMIGVLATVDAIQKIFG